MGNPGAREFEAFLSVFRRPWRVFRGIILLAFKKISMDSQTQWSLSGWRTDHREQEWKKVAQAGGHFRKLGER